MLRQVDISRLLSYWEPTVSNHTGKDASEENSEECSQPASALRSRSSSDDKEMGGSCQETDRGSACDSDTVSQSVTGKTANRRSCCILFCI
jgi:hypothetical protein